MKIFLKKINLSTVDTIVAFGDVTKVGEVRPEEFATVEAWIAFAQNDRKQRGLRLNDNILIQVSYTSILKTISIIDLSTPPPKFPSYFNRHNESIFIIYFQIIFHLIIIIFAPSFCFRVALVNVYVTTIEFSEDDSDEDDNLRSSFRRKLAIWGIKEIRMCGNCGKTFLNHLMVL